MKERIQELITKHSNLKGEVRYIEQQLVDEVLNYKGTVQEAIAEGLIRLNFPAPPGLYKHIRKDYANKED